MNINKKFEDFSRTELEKLTVLEREELNRRGMFLDLSSSQWVELLAIDDSYEIYRSDILAKFNELAGDYEPEVSPEVEEPKLPKAKVSKSKGAK
jgi:hypothetical protein